MMIETTCPHCDGRGCGKCHQKGDVWIIDRCPQREISKGTVEFFQLVEFARKGSFPLQGGTLNQMTSFLDALQIANSAQRRVNPEE